MIVPRLHGQDHYDPQSPSFVPFSIGRIDPSRGFVHVIDDFSLDALLRTLDTASDLARYLQRKEALIESERLASATGEEDLLAYYLRHYDGEGHCFEIPGETDVILISGPGRDGLTTAATLLTGILRPSMSNNPFREGPVTAGDNYRWMCGECFDDLKDRFGWTVADPPPTNQPPTETLPESPPA